MLLNYHVNEPFEKLFRFVKCGYYQIDTYYVYIQYTADDPEYDFDYTIYDKDFDDIDGGVLGKGDLPDLLSAAQEATGAKNLVEVDLNKYRKKVYSMRGFEI